MFSEIRHVCDVCKTRPPVYDARIPRISMWAFLCEHCFKVLDCELGIGKGQKLNEQKERIQGTD